MKGSVAIEYAIISIALVSLLAVLTAQSAELIGFSTDVKKVLITKVEMLRVKESGLFLLSSSGGRVEMSVALPSGVRADLNTLTAEVNTASDVCNDRCVIGAGTSPFSSGPLVEDYQDVYVVYDGAKLEVKKI